jgi:uncharacterized protein (TIGR02453 family)
VGGLNNKNKFHGFSGQAFAFLAELRDNNNKEWFETNRETYQNELVIPLRNLVSDLSEFIISMDYNLDVTPAIGKTISRIYKDARRLRGGPPYKKSMWVAFKRPLEEWKESPTFYIEIMADSYSYGMGFYSAPRDMMELFRENIVKRPAEFSNAVKFYKKEKELGLYGDYYKKIKCPEGLSADVFEWYRKKSFYLSSENPLDGLITSPEFTGVVTAAFARLAPLYHYLWKLKLRARAESEKHALKSFYEKR